MPLIREQIADDIRQQIAAGQYCAGDELPSLAALSQQYGTTVKTVQSALRILHVEGLVRLRQGARSMVLAHALPAGHPTAAALPVYEPGAVVLTVPFAEDATLTLRLSRRLTEAEFTVLAEQLNATLTAMRDLVITPSRSDQDG